MAIVNYVREHMRFIEYAADEHLSSGERLLWYALMHVMNQRAQGKVWPDGFVRVSNERLLALVPVKLDTLARARSSLRDRGLIDFISGERNSRSPAYRMCYFGDASEPGSGREAPGNPQISVNPGFSAGDISINEPKPNETSLSGKTEGEKEGETLPSTRAREEVEAAWKTNLGEGCNPRKAQIIADTAVQMGFEPGVIARAVEKAAARDLCHPTAYVLRLLRDWGGSGVKTVDDAERYAFLYTASRGGMPELINHVDAAAELQELRDELRGAGCA